MASKTKKAPSRAGKRDPKNKRGEETSEDENSEVIIEEGTGVFILPNHCKYQGQWKILEDRKKRHGIGKLTLGPDNWYEGEWQHDTIHGKGRYNFPDGAFYEGRWNNGRFHDRGTYCWADGSSYIGQWVNNKMHGLGCYVDANGKRYQARFNNDRFQNPEGQWIVLGKINTGSETNTSR